MTDRKVTPVNILRIDLRQVDVLEFVKADQRLWEAPLLALLTPELREWLLGQARLRQVSPGEVIQPAGPDQELHLVLEGGVVLSTGAGEVDLTTLGKGDCFGLSAVLPEALPLHAAADRSGVRLAALPSEAMRALLARVGELRRWLEEVSRQRQEMARDCSDFFDRW